LYPAVNLFPRVGARRIGRVKHGRTPGYQSGSAVKNIAGCSDLAPLCVNERQGDGMPLVSVRKLGNRYRLVEKGSSRIARTQATGSPRDGGGHRSKGKAMRQAGYINKALRKKGYK
jgi:hypothetical protein